MLIHNGSASQRFQQIIRCPGLDRGHRRNTHIPFFRRRLRTGFGSRIGLRNRVRPRAGLNTALLTTNLPGDRLPLVSGDGGIAFWRLLSFSPARESPSVQHLRAYLAFGESAGGGDALAIFFDSSETSIEDRTKLSRATVMA